MLRIKRSAQDGIYLASLSHPEKGGREQDSAALARIRDDHLPFYVRWQTLQLDTHVMGLAERPVRSG